MRGAELDPEQWDLASRLFEAAAALPERERGAYLAGATRDDAVRRAVEHLLEADASASPLLDATPGELAAAARSPDDDDSALIGARIGAWRIVRELGRGGMGAVYLAERADGAYEKRVAVKVVKRGMDTDEILRRFRRERQILATLEHPNIARLHDGGVTPDGRPYLVMEHIEGERIDRYADARRLDVEARLALALTVCRAVDYAHRRRIVHRDIKPSNILVTTDGDIRLLDFGIARLLDDEPDGGTRTGTGRQILTPAYASPEQLAGSPVTPAGDVFALGVLLHELLTGRRPPDPLTPATPVSGGATSAPRLEPPSRAAARAEPAVAAARNTTAPALRRRLRGDLDTIVLRATDSAPEARYATAGALADDLERHLAGAAILARPPAVGTRIRQLLATPRSLPGVAAVSIVVIGAIAAIAAVAGRGEERGAPPVMLPTLAVVATTGEPRDSADAYLVQGITDELTTRLGRLRRLRVKSSRAVAASVAGTESPEALGRRLGVTYLVESTVRRRDSTIAVALSLVETEGGFQVWSDDYATAGTDLLSLQDSMVRDIAAAITGELSTEERTLLGARPSASPVAYDHFMRANYLLGNRTPASVRAGIREYEVALTYDPQFAEALARAAYAYLLYLDWGWPHPERTPAELMRAARSLADRAVEIDPGSAEVWLSQAYLRVLRDPARHEGALEAFERSLQLDSLNAEAQHQYGQTLMVLGRDREALAAYHRALAREPQRPMTLVAMGAIHSNTGSPDSAKRWIDSALAVAGRVPAPYALAVWASFALLRGDAPGAETAARRALAMDSSYPAPARSTIVIAQAARGDSVAARVTLRELLASIDTTNPTPTDARFVSPALLAVGKVNEALALLERARPRGAQLSFYLRSRDFDRVRALPRFAALVAAADPTR